MRAPRSPRSPRSFRLDRAAILGAVLIAATACGSPASPAPASASATTTASAGPSTASPTQSASSAAGIQISDADRAALADPTTVRVAEHEARLEAAIAERSGLLAALGAEGVAWLAKDRSKALKKVLDANDIQLTDRGPVRLTSAALATGDHVPAPLGVELPGVQLVGTTFTATAIVSLGFNTLIGSPTIPGTPVNTTASTSQQTVGANRISTTTTTTTTVGGGGSTVFADLTLNQAVTTTNAATGAAVGSSTTTVHVHAEGNACPDAAGVALVKLDIEFTGDASGMGGGSVAEYRSHGEVKGQVSEAAELIAISDQVDMSYTTTANGARNTATAVTGLAMPAGATQQINNGTVPAAEAANARALMVMLTTMTAGTILVAAEKKWQGGACVRIDATTATYNDLRPNAVVTFTAKPVHKIEGIDLDKPMFATFSGEGTLAPVNTEERPPPVSYTYTAPSKKDRTGKAVLKSTSNRGIGLIEIVFHTEVKGWFVDGSRNGGTITGQHCGDEGGTWVARATYSRPLLGITFNGKQKWVFTIDSVTLKGTYTYTDNQVTVVPGATIKVTGTAAGRVTLTIDDEGIAHLALKETSHSYDAVVPGGYGNDTAPVERPQQMEWQVDETCP